MSAYHRALLAYAFGMAASTGWLPKAPEVVESRPKRNINRMPHQGKRECERRLRRMQK